MKAQEIEELLRLEREDLDGEAAERWRERLEGDSEAQDWLAWARAVRRGASSPWAGEGEADAGTPAPDPMDVAALAQGLLEPDAARDVRRQLLGCVDGMGMLRAALEECAVQGDAHLQEAFQPDVPLEEDSDPSRGPGQAPIRGGFGRVLLLAAGLLILAWAGRSVWQQATADSPDRARLVALAERSAMPTASLRSELAGGLELYGQGRWAEAAQALGAALEEEAAADAGATWLYLGSAQLMAGEDGSALASLEQAHALCEGSYAPEAAWQLAQARLLAGDGDGARGLLDGLAGTHRGGAAADLLQRMAEAD